MITILAALIALTSGAPQAKQQGQPDTTTIGMVETAGRRPSTHRITVISAFSCPYCRVLDQQGMDEIRRYWLPRGLALETIPFVLSPTDIAASIAANCGPKTGYGRRTTILFRAQPEITGNWGAASEGDKKKAASAPRGSGAPEIARLSGILALAPSLGLTTAQLQTCLKDPAMQRLPEQRQRLADARWTITGTPTVLIDGRRVKGAWADIRRALVATMAG